MFCLSSSVSVFLSLSLIIHYGSPVLEPGAQCREGLRPAMVRVAGAVQLTPLFVAKVDLVTCAMYCRRNSHPSSDEPFACRGFNFRVGRNPNCEFFAMEQPVLPVVHRQGFYYFEKTCLKIPPRCEEAAFVVDSLRGFRLKSAGESRLATTEDDCVHACFIEDCTAFEWNQERRSCSIYSKTRRDDDLEKVRGVTYYENNCIDPAARCPNGRVDFLLARKSDVQSFGVSVGVRSVRNCMRECIETTLFHCRSFQFSSSTNECFVSDESSEVAVPSETLDLYEPFCVPSFIEDNNCNRPYSFEKVITTKLASTSHLAVHDTMSVDNCLSMCLSTRRCRSVNYDVSIHRCTLLDRSRMESPVVSDEKFDFYELACQPLMLNVVTESFPHGSFHKIHSSRVLRPEFNHLLYRQVTDVQECWRRCLKTQFICRSFAFSKQNQECQLSSVDVEDKPELTVFNQLFDVYQSFKGSDVTTPFPTLKADLPFTQPTEDLFSDVTDSLNDNIFSFDESSFNTQTTGSGRTSTLKKQTTTTTVVPTTTTTSTSTTTARDSEVATLRLLYMSSTRSPPTRKPIQRDRDDWETGAVPEMTSEERNLGHVDEHRLHVTADCHPHGINISFSVQSDTYTGAVYAAERYDQCRVFVRRRSDFALFVPRPSHNTWCNAVEHHNSASVLLVLSNDRIVPHGVTTVDDLFFHVTCNYENNVTTVTKGLAVGSAYAATMIPRLAKKSVSLKITRQGHPVESVYLGETLLAKVESEVPAENIRVVDCSANRVGGAGKPSSVHLIADGCALLPSLMSAMVLGPDGWQSTLSAFRIDESENIDIVCVVALCENSNCTNHQMQCPPVTDRLPRALDSGGEVRVEGRLRVQGDRKLHDKLPQVCVQPALYVSLLLLLSVSLLAMCISVGTSLFRKRSRDNEGFLRQSMTIEEAPAHKYVKTAAL